MTTKEVHIPTCIHCGEEAVVDNVAPWCCYCGKSQEIIKQDPLSTMANAKLNYENDQIGLFKPVHSWFCDSINQECESIYESGKTPKTLFLKYPFERQMASFMSSFGPLQVIVDTEMKELLRVE